MLRQQLPNGEGWRYIGRSFCDGDDRRVYPSVSLVVAQYCQLKRTQPFGDEADWVYDQVRWGLDGAVSFLDKDGILRRALWAFPDHDTDNIFSSGDEKMLGDAFDQTATCNEYGVVNREVVCASLLIGLAEAVATFRERDPLFFDRVLALCKLGYDRIEQLFKPFQESGFTLAGHDFSPYRGKYSAAAWTWLSAVLFQITQDQRYATNAVEHAAMLIDLQQSERLGDAAIGLSGWYRKQIHDAANPWGEKPEQEVMITPWLYQCLFRMLEVLPDHPCAASWRDSIRRYARDYLLQATQLNAFGHIRATHFSSPNGLPRSRLTCNRSNSFSVSGRVPHNAVRGLEVCWGVTCGVCGICDGSAARLAGPLRVGWWLLRPQLSQQRSPPGFDAIFAPSILFQ
jgi:hypothetical protein